MIAYTGVVGRGPDGGIYRSDGEALVLLVCLGHDAASRVDVEN